MNLSLSCLVALITIVIKVIKKIRSNMGRCQNPPLSRSEIRGRGGFWHLPIYTTGPCCSILFSFVASFFLLSLCFFMVHFLVKLQNIIFDPPIASSHHCLLIRILKEKVIALCLARIYSCFVFLEYR